MNRRRKRGVAGATAAAFAIAVSLAASARSAPPPPPVPAPGASDAAVVDSGASLRHDIDVARSRLLANYQKIDARSGLADTLEARIDLDESNLFPASRPLAESTADFWQWNAAVVALDSSLVDQLTTGKPHALADVRGLDEVPLPSAGGTLTPCAIDVPSSYAPGKAMALVVLLHPQGVSEAAELAQPLFRTLAEQSDAVVIAPYARGDDERSKAAADDVYAALAQVEGAFTIDRRRVYLVGDALGGVAAYEVALWRPDQWIALLSIRSAMDPSDTTRVATAFTGKTPYVVAGTDDETVSIDDVRRNVTWLRGVGLVPMYYEMSGATHDLGSLSTGVRQAWLDMFANKRPAQASPVQLPTPTPPPSGHP